MKNKADILRPTCVVSNNTSILGSLLNLVTMWWRADGGIVPSKRKYVTAGKCFLSKSFSTMSSIALS